MSANAERGVVVGIYVAETARGATAEIGEARLVAGRGIEGDRYFTGAGTFSPASMDADHQITLIAIEEIDAFNVARGQALTPGAFRRNLVTRGIDLNALVGKRFRAGAAELRGMRLCEPCTHLAGLLSRDVLERMVHRAGLRAEIVTGGVLRPGDAVEALQTGPAGARAAL